MDREYIGEPAKWTPAPGYPGHARRGAARIVIAGVLAWSAWSLAPQAATIALWAQSALSANAERSKDNVAIDTLATEAEPVIVKRPYPTGPVVRNVTAERPLQ